MIVKICVIAQFTRATPGSSLVLIISDQIGKIMVITRAVKINIARRTTKTNMPT